MPNEKILDAVLTVEKEVEEMISQAQSEVEMKIAAKRTECIEKGEEIIADAKMQIEENNRLLDEKIASKREELFKQSQENDATVSSEARKRMKNIVDQIVDEVIRQ